MVGFKRRNLFLAFRKSRGRFFRIGLGLELSGPFNLLLPFPRLPHDPKLPELRLSQLIPPNRVGKGEET